MFEPPEHANRKKVFKERFEEIKVRAKELAELLSNLGYTHYADVVREIDGLEEDE